jgi:hypothetical protein
MWDTCNSVHLALPIMWDTHGKMCLALYIIWDMCSKTRLTLYVIQDARSRCVSQGRCTPVIGDRRSHDMSRLWRPQTWKKIQIQFGFYGVRSGRVESAKRCGVFLPWKGVAIFPSKSCFSPLPFVSHLEFCLCALLPLGPSRRAARDATQSRRRTTVPSTLEAPDVSCSGPQCCSRARHRILPASTVQPPW